MKLYNSMGPNPHVVRMFAAEKNVSMDVEEVDLMAGVNRQDQYLEVNPAGQLPCLAADDGTIIAELRPPLTIDNFEGIEARRGQRGEVLVYLVPDDNFNAEQRTLLMMFELLE